MLMQGLPTVQKSNRIDCHPAGKALLPLTYPPFGAVVGFPVIISQGTHIG